MKNKTCDSLLLLIFLFGMGGASGIADGQERSAGQSEFYSGNPQLESFLREALERNPSLREASERYEAALERLPQASSLPDPMLNLTQYVRTPETRVGPQTTMVSISQQFPWFGKLGDKEKVAAKEAAIQKEQFDVRRAEVARQVKLAYYDLAYTDRAISITEEDLAVLRHYETLGPVLPGGRPAAGRRQVAGGDYEGPEPSADPAEQACGCRGGPQHADGSPGRDVHCKTG
jgi:hypothetical protein